MWKDLFFTEKNRGLRMMKLFGNIKASKAVIISASVIGVLLVLFIALTVYTYAHSTIFPGVSAGGISLSGKTEADAVEILDASCGERYTHAKISISLDGRESFEIAAEELGIAFPSADIAKRANAIGHSGGFFARIYDVLKTIFGGVDVGVSVDMLPEAREELSKRLSKYDVEPVDAAYTIEEDVLVLHPRADGKKINLSAAFDEISKAFAEERYDGLSFEREVAEAVALDIDRVYSEVYAEVKDAYLEKGEDGNKIVPHVLGVDFDLEAARAAYNKTPDEVVKIPLSITQPKVLTKYLEVNLFKYCLAEVETHFSPKKVERTSNVRLAASFVNGTILNPGEEFSYNKVVGQRTTERGFKAAAIFAQGEVVDGIGGGICQVSSTLYMAALRANMKINERKNHAFYVDYAPKGEDATVVYGSIDFRFENTSEYPIKIVATSKDNYIRIRLMGTEPDEKVTVKLTKKTHSTTPFTVREKLTTALVAGERKVEQKGQEGLSMTVYRNVYDKNGKLIESYVENKSTYKPMPEIVLVGQGQSKPTVAPSPDNQQTEETPSPAEPEADTAPEQEAPTTEDTAPDTTSEATENQEQEAEQGEEPAESDAPDWIAQ